MISKTQKHPHVSLQLNLLLHTMALKNHWQLLTDLTFLPSAFVQCIFCFDISTVKKATCWREAEAMRKALQGYIYTNIGKTALNQK